MRTVALLCLSLLILVGCSGLEAFQPTASVLSSTALPSASPLPGLTPPATQMAPQPTPTPTSTPVPISLPLLPAAPQVPAFGLRLHPDGGLYVGDQISLELIAPPDLDLTGQRLRVQFDPDGQQISETGFGGFGIGRRYQATLHWAWNTAGLQPGDHEVTLSVQPLGITWTQTISLAPADWLPWPEPEAHWAASESDCCLFYYVTGTAAERDLNSILAVADAQAYSAANRLGLEFAEPIEVVLAPRVIGHGGFASGEITISYLDRLYVDNSLAMVLHHEMIHILDVRLGGDLRPSLLVEGLAVYLTGGHFKPEPLLPRAAALLPPQNAEDNLHLSGYIPLAELADEFYFAQHELGYLQAGALVEFLIENWGWQTFSEFYRDIHPQGERQSQAIDAALQVHFGLTLDQLDARFQEALRQQELTPELAEDVRLTVAYYDSVRRYQELLDPSAYFLTAWLPGGPALRERGIVADYLRHPAAAENLALEMLLGAAGTYLRDGAYTQVSQAIAAVNAVLDALQQGRPDPFRTDPLAQAYWTVTLALLQQGYQPQTLIFQDGQARAQATLDGVSLYNLTLENTPNAWVLVSSSD